MTSLLDRYRALPALVGRSLLPISFLARLPMSMAQFGTVLMTTTVTGDIAVAGLLAGAMALGAAVGGPLIGALADRHGQRPVIVAASLSNAVLLVGLVVAVSTGATAAVCLLWALGSGASQPQIGPLMRSRWVLLSATGGRTADSPPEPESRPADGGATHRPDLLLSTAMSYEGAADEVAYVLGPAVVSVLALLAPSAAVLAAAVLVGVFGAWVGLHPSARVHAAPVPGPPPRLGRPGPVLLTVLLMALCIGAFFGGAQTGTTALASTAGAPAAAGLIYAGMAVGSAITGLATAAIPGRFRLERRLLLFAGWLTLAVVPLLFLREVLPAAAAMLVLGAGVGPLLITMYALAEREVPTGRTGLILTLLASFTVVGYAAGSGIGGALAQGGGSAAAYTVSLVAVGVGAVAAALNAPAVRKSRPGVSQISR